MKSFYAFIIALFISVAPIALFGQEIADEWDFADHFDDTEEVSKDLLQKQTIVMPNPVMSGNTLKILLPTDVEVQPQRVAVYDTKGSKVSAMVSLNDRNLLIATNSLSSGVYFVRVTKNIKKKFVIQ